MKNRILILVAGLMMFGSLKAQNCPRFLDGDSSKTTPTFSIYREFFKKSLFSEAFPYWKKIYTSAPGFHKYTFYDGTDMYASFIQKEPDFTRKGLLTDTLFQIYTTYMKCFGEDAYITGKYAMDLLKYGKDADIPEARKYLEKNIELNGDKVYYYYIQTYFKLLLNQFDRNRASDEVIKEKYAMLSGILDRNIAKADAKQAPLYKEVKTTIDSLYEEFQDETEPKDCSQLLLIYTKRYYDNPDDLENIKQVYAKIKACADSTFTIELLRKLNTLNPSYSYALPLGSIYMKNKKFDSAFILYENALKTETDSNKLANLYFIMSNIKYESNDFPPSREYAQKALQYNPTLGKAYLLIGTLYASSGKLCGPGTGFQSQIVLWPAFDYFKKAIEVGTDDVKTEAQKMISTYTQYLPTKAEITAKKLRAGTPYTVKCWINEETTVQIK
jgi:tetratricopeptide (TPR) repeat protein